MQAAPSVARAAPKRSLALRRSAAEPAVERARPTHWHARAGAGDAEAESKRPCLALGGTAASMALCAAVHSLAPTAHSLAPTARSLGLAAKREACAAKPKLRSLLRSVWLEVDSRWGVVVWERQP